jgi:rhamnosyltransferase
VNVSIVLPTYNGAATLPALLDRLQAHRQRGVEVLAIDSGSRDGTLGLLEGKVDHLESIPPGTFNHGLTRNQGIARSRGEWVVLMVQDALPEEGWLDALVAPLAKDARVAGTFARQKPRDDASVLTRHHLLQWIAAQPQPRESALAGAGALESLHPFDRYLACVFDNVCSCVRRSVWERIPFRATVIGEDVEWAKDVLLAGHRIVYAPDAVVTHSHERDARYEFFRTYLIHQRLAELFSLQTVGTPRALLSSVMRTTAEHLRLLATAEDPLARRARQLPRALSLALAWPLGQYLGALSARHAWLRFRPRGV